MPAFRKTSSTLPAADALADCLRAKGQVLVIDSGLMTADQASRLARHLPASLSPEVVSALGLLDRLHGEDLADPWQDPDAVVQPGALRAYEVALRRLRTPDWTLSQDTLPWAAWAALADGLQPAPGDYWMQLLPCRIGLSAQAVGLIPLPSNTFTPAQVQTMATLVAQWPATLVQSASGAVFLRSEEPFGLAASAPEMLIGLHLAHHPPIGPRSRDWRQLSNEIQMAFHLLPEADGDARLAQTPWPWGAGRLPLNAHLAPHPAPPDSQQTRPSPRLAIEGLHHWLLQQGFPASLRWWQPEDTESWIAAWLAALRAVAALTPTDQPWILMATHGGQARVWASANRAPPRWYERLRIGGVRPRSLPTLQTTWLSLVTLPDTEAEA
jgi:hypothetical protein